MTPPPAFDLTPFLGRDEGQHFDRKSMFEGEEGKKRPRDRRKVRDQVAEQVAGFANAEGGVLILGIEDDHEITGHKLPPDALAALLDVPKTRLHPSVSAPTTSPSATSQCARWNMRVSCSACLHAVATPRSCPSTTCSSDTPSAQHGQSSLEPAFGRSETSLAVVT